MSDLKTYDKETMLNAAQNILACEQALRKITAYAREYCTLEGAFGLLMQPLQPIHNGARDAVMDNLEALGDTLTVTAQSVLDSYADAAELEKDIERRCKKWEKEIDGGTSTENQPHDHGNSGGSNSGGGSNNGGSGGGTPPPPPVTPPPVAPPLPPVDEPELQDKDKEDECEEDERCHNPDCYDPRCKGECESRKDKEHGAEIGRPGHPVGCRCTLCDVHPKGCQCELCLAETVQDGCPPSCIDCRSGKPHLPDWYIGHGKWPGEVSARPDYFDEARLDYEREMTRDQAQFEERKRFEQREQHEQDEARDRYERREGIEIIRGKNQVSDLWGGNDPVATCGGQPGSLGFSISALITAAYSGPSVERIVR